MENPICEIHLISDDLTAEKSKTRFLAEIVIMTKSKKWPQMEKDLLDLHGICKRYPANGVDPLHGCCQLLLLLAHTQSFLLGFSAP